MKGLITIDFIEECTTVNSTSDCKFLKQNSPYFIEWYLVHMEPKKRKQNYPNDIMEN